MHANISKRAVVGRLVAHAHIRKESAIGYLAMFWGAVSQHCPGGDIAKVSDPQIEAWAEWDRKAGVFAQFVRQLHSTSGVVNDYDEYSGALEDRRARDRRRKAAARAARKAQEEDETPPHDNGGKSDRVPPDVPPTSAGLPAHDTRRYDTSTTKRTKGRGQAAPWMGPVRELHREFYPNGRLPVRTADTLRPLVDEHGIDAVLVDLRPYLAKTPAQYLSFPKFVSTFGTWGGGKQGVGELPAKYRSTVAAENPHFRLKNGYSTTREERVELHKHGLLEEHLI